jgi:phage gpG-like protein
MPPKSRSLTPTEGPRLEGLRLDEGLRTFEFHPSIGILARDIHKLGMDIRSFRQPLVRAIKRVMIPSFRENFDQEGRPAWEPMSEATEMIRERDGTSGPLLNRSGKLKRVAQQQNIWTVTKESASVRDLPSSVWYGKIQQAGTGSSMGSQIKAELTRAAKGGKRISQSEASRRVMSRLDQKLRTGKAGAGGSGRQANIPPRPFVMFQDEDIDAVYEVFQEWLDERARGAGWLF